MGLIYGHLRAENILVQFDPPLSKDVKNPKVLSVKLFGHMMPIEPSQNMLLSEYVEHLPPEFLRYYRENSLAQNGASNSALQNLN